MYRLLLSVVCCLVVTAASCRMEEAPEGTPAALDTLAAGWTRIAPGGETTCATGTPYAFYVRPGAPENLLVYFQGGGACWQGVHCDVQAQPTYDPVVNASDDPARAHGIFALDHPENPFAGYTMVFVPYCTGDVHLGDRVATYDVPATDSTGAREITIRHRGFTNAMAALGWAFEHVTAPDTVFVAGGSAGAIASPFYAARVAEAYPGAHVVQLGDAAGAYRSRAFTDVFRQWGSDAVLARFPEYEGVPEDSLDQEVLYTASARRYPGIQFAQYNTAADSIQMFFQSMFGETDRPLQQLIEANYADIRAQDPDFRTFTAGGHVHTVLTRPDFYAYRVGGVRFRDWLDDLVAGRPVDDLTCTACDRVETAAGPPVPSSPSAGE